MIWQQYVSEQQLNSVILIKPWYCCHNQVPSFPHYWLITRFVTRVTQWVPLVKQELLTFPKHLRSPPSFLWDSSYSILFSVYCFVIIACLSSPFFWPLYCLPFFKSWLLITPLVASDYPFSIFWLPLWWLLITPLVASDYPFGIF